MCDFHSVIVTGDGRILHLSNNSHSSIAAHYGLDDAITSHWWECEWNGRGEMPLNLVQNRRDGAADPTQTAERAAASHYCKLAAILAVDADDNTVFPAPFDQPEFEDVRQQAKAAKVERERRAAAEAAEAVRKEQIAEAEAEAKAVVEKFEAAFISFNHDQEVAFIRHLIESSALSVSVEDVAEKEIDQAREDGEESGSESSYWAGYDDGREAASEDLFSQDYMDEQIAEAVKEAESNAAEARSEGYAEGFLACKNGATPAVEYINGLPAFLFG